MNMHTRARQMVTRAAGGAVVCFAGCLPPAADARSLERVSGPGRLSSYFESASPDGSRVYFATRERLTADDSGSGFDLYSRRGRSFTRISRGVGGRQLAPANADLEGVAMDFVAESPGGSRVIFYSNARLTRDDRDRSSDLFEWRRGRLQRLSRGTRRGNGNYDVYVGAISRDARRVVFTTEERLSPADHDRTLDVYERVGSKTTLVSPAPVAGPARDVFVSSASADARRLILSTEELASGGTTTLVSGPAEGPPGGAPGGDFTVDRGRFESSSRFLYADRSLQASADGSRVFFSTSERLTADDLDRSRDVYAWSGGRLRRVSTGSKGGNGRNNCVLESVSADGTRVIFSTAERLEPDDTDASVDVYERAAGETRRVSGRRSAGNGRFGSRFVSASPDARRVYFETQEGLLSGDRDRGTDVYVSRE